MAAVQAPIIPILGEWIRQSPGTISLGQGMVGYGPPQEALAAVPRFLAEPGAHRYGPVEGLPALVEALTHKLTAENHLDLSRSRVVVTAGGNLAFMNAVLAVADPGDEVILQAPYYFNHEMAVVMAGCRPVVVPTDARYQLQVDAIASAITPRTRAVVTISPNNPTGAVYPEADLRAVNDLCAARGVWHIHDEVYEYFTYGRPHFSPASIARRRRPHDLALLAVEGVRLCQLAHRLHDGARDAVGGREQDPGHAAHLPAARLASGGRGRARRGTRLLRRPHRRPGRRAPARAGAARGHRRHRGGAIGRRRALLPGPRGDDDGFDDAGPTPDPRAPGGDRARQRVWLLSRPATCLRVSYGALAPETVDEGMARLVRGIKAIVAERRN